MVASKGKCPVAGEACEWRRTVGVGGLPPGLGARPLHLLGWAEPRVLVVPRSWPGGADLEV